MLMKSLKQICKERTCEQRFSQLGNLKVMFTMPMLMPGYELMHCRHMSAVTLGSVRTRAISVVDDSPSVAMSRRIG